MDEAWIRVIVYVLTTIMAVGVSLVFVLPKILEKFVIERVKFKNQIRLKETESSLQIYGDILKSAIEASGASGQELRRKSINSVETLWKEILRVESEFGSLVGIVNITTDQELNELVRSNVPSQAGDVLKQFSDLQSIVETAGMDKSPELLKERIYISEKLWNIFGALVGIHGRLAILVHYGLSDKKTPDWKQDKLMIRFATYVISDEEWKEIQEMKLSGFRTLAERIRQEFLKEAKKTMRGTEQFSETLEDYHSIVTQQEIMAYEERSKRAVSR